MGAALSSPFEVLADYERRSLAHVAGQPERIDAPGLWRGIAFRVGEREFASGISEINELLTPQPLTPVPGTQPWLMGIANVRGNLVPVVDLSRFLFGERTHPTDRCRILLVRQHGGHVGLLIDEVLGQRSVLDEHRDAAERESDERVARFVEMIVTVGEQRFGLFDMSRLARAPDFLQAAN